VFELRDVDPLTSLYTGPESDNHWTYQGRFILLAATSIAADTTLGGIYIDYDIEFFIPQLAPEAGYMAQFGAWTPSITAPLGTSQLREAWSNLPFKINVAGDAIQLTAGYHTLNYYMNGTGMTAGSDHKPLRVTSGAETKDGSSETSAGGLDVRGWITFLVTAAGWVTFSAAGRATTIGSSAFVLSKGPLPSKIPAATAEVKELVAREVKAARMAASPLGLTETAASIAATPAPAPRRGAGEEKDYFLVRR
jgi:hypothetical protein